MDNVEIWEVLVRLSGNEISLKEAHNQICSLSVSVSVLKKAYDLIPDLTSHEDLIEIKHAIFGND
jgi:ABC-type arginine transport system ATPase subunit